MDKRWESARIEFWNLLDSIEGIRMKLHCNISNAWFRGHEDTSWDLETSCFRIKQRLIDPDRKKQIELFKQEKEKLKLKLKKIEDEQKKIRLENSVNFKTQTNINKESLNQLPNLKRDSAIIKEQLTNLDLKINVTDSIRNGEPESFVNWSRRSERDNKNSWEILAEMQHYKVATRLLDWTENLSIAFYFAIEKYIERLVELWSDENNISFKELPFIVPENMKTPCIWILNPYKLAHYTTKDRTILDPTISPDLDYFKAFFLNKNWKFRSHTPIYPPWRNPRIMAQQGMFTVQGWDKNPLNKQLESKENILDKIEVTPNAAIYAAKHLLTFQGIDRFFVYRDLDNLGISVKDKFQLNKRMQ